MAQIILDRLTAQFTAGEVIELGSALGNEWARIKRESWTTVAKFLRDDPALKLEMFIDLTAVDRLGLRGYEDAPRFDVVLHLYSVSHKHRIRLYCGVPEEDPSVETLVPIWAGADWLVDGVWVVVVVGAAVAVGVGVPAFCWAFHVS